MSLLIYRFSLFACLNKISFIPFPTYSKLSSFPQYMITSTFFHKLCSFQSVWPSQYYTTPLYISHHLVSLTSTFITLTLVSYFFIRIVVHTILLHLNSSITDYLSLISWQLRTKAFVVWSLLWGWSDIHIVWCSLMFHNLPSHHCPSSEASHQFG